MHSSGYLCAKKKCKSQKAPMVQYIPTHIPPAYCQHRRLSSWLSERAQTTHRAGWECPKLEAANDQWELVNKHPCFFILVWDNSKTCSMLSAAELHSSCP